MVEEGTRTAVVYCSTEVQWPSPRSPQCSDPARPWWVEAAHESPKNGMFRHEGEVASKSFS